MKRFLKSEVDDEIEVCPYCMNPPPRGRSGCCGESSAHFETAYDIKGELYLESEIELYDDQSQIDTAKEKER